jgi:hypothetical protein
MLNVLFADKFLILLPSPHVFNLLILRYFLNISRTSFGNVEEHSKRSVEPPQPVFARTARRAAIQGFSRVRQRQVPGYGIFYVPFFCSPKRDFFPSERSDEKGTKGTITAANGTYPLRTLFNAVDAEPDDGPQNRKKGDKLFSLVAQRREIV